MAAVARLLNSLLDIEIHSAWFFLSLISRAQTVETAQFSTFFSVFLFPPSKFLDTLVFNKYPVTLYRDVITAVTPKVSREEKRRATYKTETEESSTPDAAAAASPGA